MKERKILLIIISLILIISLISVILILLLNNKSEKVTEEEINEEELEMQFNEKFNNKENEYISALYNIKEKDAGKYDIEANIPYSHISPEIDNFINKEINNIFAIKLLEIYNTSKSHTIFRINYATNINNNILSLAIKCTLKEAGNAQRTIIKTYNFDINTMEKIEILDLIPQEERSNLQEKINEKIQKQIQRENTIAQQGYNVYRRDKNSDMYILENATEFYIENNILYIIYSYGNNNYTSEVDLIINKI